MGQNCEFFEFGKKFKSKSRVTFVQGDVMRKQLMSKCLVGAGILFGALISQAGMIDWSGTYRFEANMINNSELSSEDYNKDYGLHHLVLKGMINAGDGLKIHSRFDLFNNSAYPNSQLGAVWGDGVGSASNNANDSNVISQNMKAEMIAINNLYLTVEQEHGALLVGRVPMHFGLGINLNAGNGEFDHWFDNADTVAYKIVMGNMYIMPMYSKFSEGSLELTRDDVTETAVQFQYENPESELEFGAMYSTRSSTESTGNDAPTGTPIWGAGSAKSGVYTAQTIGVYAVKDLPKYRVGFEFAVNEGKTGFLRGGQEVSLKGTGVAFEFDWKPEAGLFQYGIKAGYASGDDPDTTEFEGFFFDRNYDVAFLLFNHQLGQDNFFRTDYWGGGGSAANTKPDVETISNVTYFSPYISYKWSEKWNLGARVTGGYLNSNPISGKDVEKSLGFEFDFSVKYKPNNRVSWVTEFGLLTPGAAFKADGTYEAKTAYGLTTKAAISF